MQPIRAWDIIRFHPQEPLERWGSCSSGWSSTKYNKFLAIVLCSRPARFWFLWYRVGRNTPSRARPAFCSRMRDLWSYRAVLLLVQCLPPRAVCLGFWAALHLQCQGILRIYGAFMRHMAYRLPKCLAPMPSFTWCFCSICFAMRCLPPHVAPHSAH